MKSFTKNKKSIKTKSLEEILNKSLKSPTFKEVYNEELFRLKIASEIKNLRTTKKLTQEKFAEKANMPQSVVARIESGKHSISLDTLNRIAFALGKQVQLV